MRKYNFISAEQDQKLRGAKNGKEQEQRSSLLNSNLNYCFCF